MERCSRCGGSGELPKFRHVEGGVCFRCKGNGVEPERHEAPKARKEPKKAESIEAQLHRARREWKRLFLALKASTDPKEREKLQKQLNALTAKGKALAAKAEARKAS